MPRVDNYLARAHRLTGDPVAAIVLLRLQFLYEGALKYGKTTTPQSHTDLMEETACSMKQIKRAVSLLREQNHIDWKMAVFNHKTIGHYSLPSRTREALKGHEAGPIGSNAIALKGPIIEQEDIQEDIQEEILLTQTEAGPETENSLGEIEVGHSTKDVLALVAKMHNPMKPSKLLELTWLEKIKHWFDVPIMSMTAKQSAQLRLFFDACPVGTATTTLKHVMDLWISFGKFVKEQAGLKTYPQQPTVAFLATYRHYAIKFVNGENAGPASTPVIEAAPSPPVQLVANLKKPSKLTMAQILDPNSDLDDDD
jgi:hypothetical protein